MRTTWLSLGVIMALCTLQLPALAEAKEDVECTVEKISTPLMSRYGNFGFPNKKFFSRKVGDKVTIEFLTNLENAEETRKSIVEATAGHAIYSNTPSVSFYLKETFPADAPGIAVPSFLNYVEDRGGYALSVPSGSFYGFMKSEGAVHYYAQQNPRFLQSPKTWDRTFSGSGELTGNIAEDKGEDQNLPYPLIMTMVSEKAFTLEVNLMAWDAAVRSIDAQITLSCERK